MGYVDKELTKMFGTTDVPEAVAKMLGIERIPATVTTNEDGVKWERAGGESYLLPCDIAVDGQNVSAVFKANVTTLPEQSHAQALKRRQLLQQHGVKTPHLYGEGSATVLEEFLPHSIEEAYAEFGDTILPDLAHAHGVIGKLGFQPVSNGILRDFRADSEGNMYMIDFGSDLGAAKTDNPNRNLWDSFAKELATRLDIDNDTIANLKSHYDKGFKAKPAVAEAALTL